MILRESERKSDEPHGELALLHKRPQSAFAGRVFHRPLKRERERDMGARSYTNVHKRRLCTRATAQERERKREREREREKEKWDSRLQTRKTNKKATQSTASNISGQTPPQGDERQKERTTNWNCDDVAIKLLIPKKICHL